MFQNIASDKTPGSIWLAAVLLFLGSITLSALLPFAAPIIGLVLAIGGILGYRRAPRVMAISAFASGVVIIASIAVLSLFFMASSVSVLP